MLSRDEMVIFKSLWDRYWSLFSKDSLNHAEYDKLISYIKNADLSKDKLCWACQKEEEEAHAVAFTRNLCPHHTLWVLENLKKGEGPEFLEYQETDILPESERIKEGSFMKYTTQNIKILFPTIPPEVGC